MTQLEELKKWLNEIGNHYSSLKELNHFTDHDGYVYSTYETVRKKIEEIEAKVFSSNAMLSVTSDSKENKKESEVAIDFAQIERLIEEYKKEEMPNANEPFHYEAKAAAGFKYFIRWLKCKSEKATDKL